MTLFDTPETTPTLAEIERDEHALPEWTTEGPVCAACSMWDPETRKRIQVRHASVAAVRLCADRRADRDAEARAEVEAEGAWLRYAEGGWDRTGEYAWDSFRTSM